MKKKKLSLIFSIAIIALVAQLSICMTVVPSILSNNNSEDIVSVSDPSDSDDSAEDLQDSEKLDDVVCDTNIDSEYKDLVSMSNSDSDSDEQEEKLVESVVSGEFNGHTVTVSGLMPEGTTIKLSDVDGSSVDKLMNEMGQDNSVFACDIKLIDADGNEWQPAENGVDVSISGFEIEDENKLEFYHIAEDIDTVLSSDVTDEYVGIIDEVALSRDGEASFETFGFSTYIGFTVDFHYNGSTFSIAGMSDVLLSEIFTQLQIQRDATKVTSLTFSDNSLISVERQENGDWILTSLKAFSTTESLKMTFENGEVIEMVVTDATTNKYTSNVNFSGIEVGGIINPSGRDLTITVTGGVYLQNPIVVPKGKRLIIKCSSTASSCNFWKYENFVGSMIDVESGGALKIDGSGAPSNHPLTFNGKMKQSSNKDAVALTIKEPLIIFRKGSEEYSGETYKFGYCIMNDVVMRDIKATGYSGSAIQINGKLNEVNIKNCKFRDITGNDAGAAIKFARDTKLVTDMKSSDTAKPGQIYLSNNTFEYCTSGNYGGAVSINCTVAGEITIDNSTFTNCKALRGGAIRFNGTTKKKTTISECSFNSCEATDATPAHRVGGAVYIQNDTSGETHNSFYINGTTFESCKAHRGGGIFLGSDSVINYNFYVQAGSKFSNCEAWCDDTCKKTHASGNQEVYEETFGGAIGINNGSKIKETFNLGKVTFSECKTSGNGGAIFVNSTIKNFAISPNDDTSLTEFKNCTAGINGGGICFYDGSDITNMYINKNASEDIGSNGLVTKHDTDNYTDSEQTNSVVRFIDCKCNRGGGALIFRGKVSGTCKILKTLIDGCESTNGSALYLEGVNADIKSMEIKDTVVRNCISKKFINSTQHGGTIRTIGPVKCDLTLNHCMVYNNKSWLHGGGLYWNAAGSDATKVTITGCTFDSNNACSMGGGIYCESDMVIEDTIVKNNTSGKDGGGIAQTIYNNINTPWSANETNLTLGEGVKVYNNTAANNGGGIAILLRYSKNVHASDRSDILKNGFTFSFTMEDVETDAVVYNNTAGVYGGGVYYGTGGNDGVYSDAPLSKNDLKAQNHTASDLKSVTPEQQQGIVDLYKKKINIEAGSIYENIAGTDGGGIYAKGKSVTINVSNGEIYSNSAGVTDDETKSYYVNNIESDLTTDLQEIKLKLSESTVGQGGGICIKGESAECIFKGGKVGEGGQNLSDNGGGVAADKATIYIDCENINGTIVDLRSTSNIINNKAYVNGGGLYVTNGGKIVMYGGAVYGNSADANGGGAYVTDDGSSIEIHGGNIGDNVANNGGGISCVNSATAKMTGGNIQSNKATCKGGGVYLDSATFEMSSGNISSNAAIEADNSYGGGLYITNNSNLTFTGGNITNNTAQYIGGGLYLDNSTAEIGGNISDNGSLEVNGTTIDTTYGGGAFIVNNSTLTLTGSITGNKASHSAGGIGLDTATLNMTNGNITKNSAVYGGGIFASKKSNITVTGTTSSSDGVTYGNISYNTAEKGGGIHVKDCNVTLKNATLEHNKATNGPGGAIYVIGGGTVSVSEGFIRYNEALGTNTSTTAYGTTDYTGIGGGVCIADGASATNRTTFTLSGGNIGIYENTASFAADDVYASGKYTDLDVPNKSEMNLTGYKGNAKGWYEDYPNKDTKYTEGIGMDSLNIGSRYRSDVQCHSRKHIFENVDVATAGETSYVNNADTYVAMTLGVSTNGTLTVSKSIIDKNGKNFDGMEDTEFTFHISRYVNGTTTSLTETELKTIKYTLNDGNNYVLNSNGDFVLQGGQIAKFTGLNGEYVIEEIVEGKPYQSYVLSTSYEMDRGTNTNGTTTSPFILTDGNAVDIHFKNTLKSVDITFKFYDRNMTDDGVPADIDSTPTTYTKTFIGEEYQNYIREGKSAFTSMINSTGIEVGAKYKNVVDEYYLWSSQADAIKDLTTKIKNLHTGESYSYKEIQYHTDRYGRPQETTGCEVEDSEKWVTYYCGNTSKDFEKGACNVVDVSSINIWLYNTPKTYTVRIYKANSDSMLSEFGDKYVASDNSNMYSNLNVYYNQRLGGALDSDTNENTPHLNAYGIKGYLGEFINTSPVVDDVEVGALKFSYWSFDRDGKTVASTETYYNNRITNDLELYAVYEENPSKAPGVTISKNEIDKIIGSDGLERTRINTMLNPYNCPNDDANIERVSVIYIVSSTGEIVDVAQFRKVIKQSLIDNEGKTSFTIKDSETSQVYYVYVNPVLSNKNRVQFTGSFKTASLAGKSVSAFAAMYYNGTGLDGKSYNEWIVSDNCAEYKFNADGACSSEMLR